MQVQNPVVYQQLEKIASHYRQNVASPYLKGEFHQLHLEHTTWKLIEELTEKNLAYRMQTFHLDDIYRMLSALALFVLSARANLVDKIPSLIKRAYQNKDRQEQLIAIMSAENFAGNVGLLANYVREVFNLLRQIDEEAAAQNKTKPLHQTMAECKILKELIA